MNRLDCHVAGWDEGFLMALKIVQNFFKIIPPEQVIEMIDEEITEREKRY